MLQSQQVTLGGDGEVLPVKFDLVPDAAGRRTLCVRIQAPAEDRNPADNSREADIEIVDRKTHVLLLADGPMREYQFLRNQLFRDRYTTVDVLLQSGRPGMSQEASEDPRRFPGHPPGDVGLRLRGGLRSELGGDRRRRAQLLEKWVAEQGGGLIVIAGPVNACKGVGGWVSDPALGAVRNLYPVEFPGRLAAAESSMYATHEPWPLEFTREGSQSDFLWLGDTAAASQEAWATFSGGLQLLSGAWPEAGGRRLCPLLRPPRRPGRISSRSISPGSSTARGACSTWAAARCGGCGRSVRAYFEQFYTKLIRHVSQGRLLRGSSRGVLLVGQDRYLLGGTVEVRRN